jgi:trk system potassium uptake protein TrkA
MKVIIMGCGRMGASLAGDLDLQGHDVVVIDIDSDAFQRLPSDFGGLAIRGNGTNQDTQKRAGVEEADVFVSVTAGDNRNVVAAQIAKHIFNVPKIVSRIYDPIRNEMYKDLGLETMSPTILGVAALRELILNAPITSR